MLFLFQLVNFNSHVYNKITERKTCIVYIILVVLSGLGEFPKHLVLTVNTSSKTNIILSLKSRLALYPSLIKLPFSDFYVHLPFYLYLWYHQFWSFVPSRFVVGEWWSDTVDSFAVKPKLTAPGKLYFLTRVRANTWNFIFTKETLFSQQQNNIWQFRPEIHWYFPLE